MDLRDLLAAGRLCANPERYDYVHHLDLDEHGMVSMMDGGGQALRREIVGRVTILEAAADRARVRFSELFDVDPYERSPERTPVDDLELEVRLELGPFALPCEVVWHVEEEEAPWLVFEHRLAFESDPLTAGREMPSVPPEFLEHPQGRQLYETIRRGQELGRRYYRRELGQELPWREIRARGLQPDAVRIVP